jgi:alkylation response protein AidB-like acyl-CoA dehydrogenase
MAFIETDEQQLLRQSVRQIADKYGHKYFIEKAIANQRQNELWEELGSMGYLGVNLPEEYGGGGMGLTELAIVQEEVSAAGCPLLMIVVSPAIVGPILAKFGSPEQKERWLKPVAEGKKKMAFAITEPDAGSNSHNISVTAKKDGDVYRLNGTKYYISGVDEAEAILVVTRTGIDEKTQKGQLSLFMVDVDSPGLEKHVLPVEIKAPEKQFTLFFDNVEVPKNCLIGEEGHGLKQVFTGLNPERILVAALAVGAGRYALDKACDYARNRQVWGSPIGAHQGLAHPLAIAKVNLEMAALMNKKAAWQFDNGIDASEAANMAKYAAAEAAIAALDQAMQTHGGNGMSSEYGLADFWGTVRLMRTAPISKEMILNFVAQHSLGLPKSY